MTREFDLSIDEFDDSPFFSIISFHKVLESLETIVANDPVAYRVAYAEALLAAASQVPELRTGVTSSRIIYENAELIKNLLADLFPTALSDAEIKAVSLPFQNFKFNFTSRFQHILQEAGPDFELVIRSLEVHQFYIISCCIILNKVFGEQFDLSQPLFYDIPNKYGVVSHYRITHNVDFMEIVPTENAVEITPEIIKELKNNFHDLALWKKYFPKHSWKLVGFGILNLIDVTVDSSLSTLKTKMLSTDDPNNYPRMLQESFQSLFRLKDLQVGLHIQSLDEQPELSWSREVGVNSHLRLYQDSTPADLYAAYLSLFKTLDVSGDYFCVTDTAAVQPNVPWFAFMQHLAQQNIRSFILARVDSIADYNVHVELISSRPYGLHTVNANKLNPVMPLINDTFERVYESTMHHLEAIIQREFTPVHPSVHWRFQQEAEHYFLRNLTNQSYTHQEIKFEQVFPLYGAVDIKSSTFIRNQLIQADTVDQLQALAELFALIYPGAEKVLVEQRQREIGYYLELILGDFSSHLDLQIHEFISDRLHGLLEKFAKQSQITDLYTEYQSKLDPKDNRFSKHRKAFDISFETVNTNLAELIDSGQHIAQNYFPHYFERFRTDGIEHTIYIGSSIAPGRIFDPMFWHQLRLWQLEMSTQMIASHYRLVNHLPLSLDVSSLILAYPIPISIRFRMDEKRFDVAGVNDIRYEMIKKRIDKAHVKDTQERIVQPGKITVVYLNESDRDFYMSYFEFLQTLGSLELEIEDFELEDLQETIGLRALRIAVNRASDHNGFSAYTDWANFIGSRK